MSDIEQKYQELKDKIKRLTNEVTILKAESKILTGLKAHAAKFVLNEKRIELAKAHLEYAPVLEVVKDARRKSREDRARESVEAWAKEWPA